MNWIKLAQNRTQRDLLLRVTSVYEVFSDLCYWDSLYYVRTGCMYSSEFSCEINVRFLGYGVAHYYRMCIAMAYPAPLLRGTLFETRRPNILDFIICFRKNSDIVITTCEATITSLWLPY
jgi:hypothetical protein